MKGIRFSKLPKHRKFNYSPVYYDEAKEELHSRVDDIKREMGELESDTESVKNNILKAFQAKQSPKRFGTVSNTAIYNIKVVSIAIILSIIFYYLWDSNLLEIIFGNLKK